MLSDPSEDEGIEDYKKGGYHPVFIGEVLNGRYVILQKLGWGHFSTVWLSRDIKFNTFVAIKVQKSASHYLEAAFDEVEILQKAVTNANHPGFLDAMADHVAQALGKMGLGAELIFTAHSIPMSMASSCRYEEQLREASRLIAARVGHERWSLVWQSRSGPPTVPWLEPDIVDYLRARPDRSPVVIAPVGFLSDHIEVLWDLDNEAREACEELGIPIARAATVGTHPRVDRNLS